MADHQLRILARRLAVLERDRLLRKQPQLAYSSVDDGAIIVTQDGDTTMQVGEQYDGTVGAVPLVGPPPPDPSLPTLQAVHGGLVVSWDGLWLDPLAVAPMDFARVDIVVSQDPAADFIATPPTTAIASPRGGSIFIALSSDAPWYVALVARSATGKASNPILAAAPLTPLAPVDGAEVQAAQDAADAAAQDAADALAAANTAAGQAADALSTAQAADQKADDAAAAAAAVADASKVLIQSTAPAAEDQVASTLWIDTTNGDNIPKHWDGTSWVAIQDASIQAAADAAADAAAAAAAADQKATDAAATASDAATAAGAADTKAQAAADAAAAADDKATQAGADIVAVQSLVDGQAVQITDAQGGIDQNTADLADVRVIAVTAQGVAETADGRVAISDYEPGPEDVAGKVDGSLWITRTRDRQNINTNPSFEVSLAGWAATAASILRVSPGDAPDGTWAMQVTNDATTGEHLAYMPTRYDVAEGQDFSHSGYLKSVSGATAGVFARVEFYDATGVFLSRVDGDPVDIDPLLYPDDLGWTRPSVTVTGGLIPAGTATAMVAFVNPNASAVWLVDSVLTEYQPKIGRYFDGNSVGGTWLDEDAPGLSASVLDGGAIIRLFTLEDGGWKEKFWTADTISSVNASTIDQGEMNGGFIADNTIAVDKQYADELTAIEDLTAGSLVNIFNDDGMYVVRLAQAAPGFDACGFVLSDCLAGDDVIVYTQGYNPLMANLQPGIQFLSTTPGECSSTPPQDIGTLVQRVGSAPNVNTLNFTVTTSVALT